MIVDASVVVDAVGDTGPRGIAAAEALMRVPRADALTAPGHFAFGVLSGLRRLASRPAHPFSPTDMERALSEAEALDISIHGTTWSDVARAYELSQGSLRYEDAIYVAAAERLGSALLTADRRIARSGAPVRCEVITVA